MIVRPHVPGFMDIDPEPPEEFTTLADLLAVPFVKRWADDLSFVRWKTEPNGNETVLIAVTIDGPWVVAYLSQFPFPGSEGLNHLN